MSNLGRAKATDRAGCRQNYMNFWQGNAKNSCTVSQVEETSRKRDVHATAWVPEINLRNLDETPQKLSDKRYSPVQTEGCTGMGEWVGTYTDSVEGPFYREVATFLSGTTPRGFWRSMC